MLIVERSEGAGGCVRGLEHDGHMLDTAVSTIARGVEDELRDGILAHLGARERCTLVPVETAYRAYLPQVTLDARRDSYADAFPDESEAIDAFFDSCDRILEDTHRLPLQLPLEQLDAIAEEFPVFVRYRSATLAEALDEHFRDPQVKAAVAVSWPWAGLPPDRLSFTTFAQGLALVGRGTYAVEGSFQRLVDALTGGFRDAGGEIQFGFEVKELGDISAAAVVSTADTRLLDADQLPTRVRRMRPSLSAFVLFAATDQDFDAGEVFLGTGGMWASVTGSNVVIRALGSRDDPEPFDKMIAAADRAFTGFRESSTILATLTPSDLEARTGNVAGAIYGWENTPSNTGSRRLPIAGLAPGLYLAGHWAQPGHGVYRALLSGMHAAGAVLADRGAPDAIPDFRS